MVDFIPSEGNIEPGSKMVLNYILNNFSKETGVCYYKHPIFRTNFGYIPDIALFLRDFQPIVIKIIPYRIEEIDDVNDITWVINAEALELSPVEDLREVTRQVKIKIEDNRDLRDDTIKPISLMIFPFIHESEFKSKIIATFKGINILWSNEINRLATFAKSSAIVLNDLQWKLLRATIQGAGLLNRSKQPANYDEAPRETMGDALIAMEKQITYLDNSQEKAAVQIAPGPQRIRGLAGTGKTVLLAMKAANIHLHYPDAKILVTFYSQSLYESIRELINQFYMNLSNSTPDWDKIHIRHGWGGIKRSGVYSDLCNRLGIRSYAYREVRSFQLCCNQVLGFAFDAIYDYILVDEAQDFPSEFFKVLFRLSKDSHKICWAYDELQNLQALEIPGLGEMFGVDIDGKPNVNLDDLYDEQIEKDLILYKSYRCHRDILMLAHALGLGLYSDSGCVQMIDNKSSWESIGYSVQDGDFQTDDSIVIKRPEENSPNKLKQFYPKEKLFQCQDFPTIELEARWIADSIASDIQHGKIRPEKIMVVTLGQIARVKEISNLIQQRLITYHGISSLIPGITSMASVFSQKDRVTLTTVHRAKGNEAHVVYVNGIQAIYDYVEGVNIRNQVFTAITRSKGWVKISGVGMGSGNSMARVKGEIERIERDIPYFKFTFPDMKNIKRLGDTKRRRQIKRQADDFVQNVKHGDMDYDALISSGITPERAKQIIEWVKEAQTNEI